MGCAEMARLFVSTPGAFVGEAAAAIGVETISAAPAKAMQATAVATSCTDQCASTRSTGALVAFSVLTLAWSTSKAPEAVPADTDASEFVSTVWGENEDAKTLDEDVTAGDATAPDAAHVTAADPRLTEEEAATVAG